jgi:homoserine O-succinyltransferase/O-acetyltransferase
MNSRGLLLGAQRMLGSSAVEFRESDANCIDIGLVNNMPSAALEATERQFCARLATAAGGITVRLTLFALPGVPRTRAGRQRVRDFYSSLSELWDRRLDGLIVTGTEPRTPDLKEEPYWEDLTRLMDWAGRYTSSTVWSCLAAHAALLHIDGIARRPLSRKRFGVFECARVSEHPLMALAPSRWRMPHSRWNDVPADTLGACGYQVLTRSQDAGADAFVKPGRSLFVFFQGHPEYDADTLLREYRRDIRRFLKGERPAYPSMPRGYFDRETAKIWTAIRDRSLQDRREDLLSRLPAALAASRVENTWHSAADCLYLNWLQYLRAQKERRLRARQKPAACKQMRAVAFAAPQAAASAEGGRLAGQGAGAVSL